MGYEKFPGIPVDIFTGFPLENVTGNSGEKIPWNLLQEFPRIE